MGGPAGAVTAADVVRLASFYGALSPSLETISTALKAAGLEGDHIVASDLYERDLDCHNLGMHKMLEVLADAVTRQGAPTAGEMVLDVGCGLGGPGRFLVDRFGCGVVGIDLLALRVERAHALSGLTGMRGSTSYLVVDATRMAFKGGAFAQVWMLDVGVHVRAKHALFAEIAGVLRPGGLFVMHDQTGPLPRAMLPLRRLAPYVAPSLPRLLSLVEDAGMRVLTWADTTDRVHAYFSGLRATLVDASHTIPHGLGADQLDQGVALLDAYIETLEGPRGRTGILTAQRLANDRLTREDRG